MSTNLCFYPTTVCIIDDKSDFLKAIYSILSEESATYKLYDNALRFLEFINSGYSPNPITKRYVKEIDTPEYHQRAYNFNIYHLYQEIYNSDRFSQISCIVVDHDMPGMKGLELCEKITDKHIRKIMLTGAADEQMAINAFNKGIIDGFINKADPDMHIKLNKAILDAQIRYFRELTIIPEQAIKHEKTPTILFEPKFKEIFDLLLKKHKIVEYYLFEMFGSFVLLNESGKVYGLFVVPEDEIGDWVEEAVSENTLSKSSIAALKSREKIICHWLKENTQNFPPLAERETNIRPAQRFEGNSGVFYYAWTEDIIQLDTQRIANFKNFKSNLTY